jgi:hypothetical protein
MQMPMLSRTVNASVISMMTLVNALTICASDPSETTATAGVTPGHVDPGQERETGTHAKPDRSNGQSERANTQQQVQRVTGVSMPASKGGVRGAH